MTPLVCLHGFSGSPASWDTVISLLASTLPPVVVCPSIGGHDDTPAPASFDEEVDRVADVVRERGAVGAHLCGYSLGGRIAMGLLARHASLFSGATLIGANVSLPAEQRPARAEQDEVWARMIEHQGIDAFVARWEAQPLFATQQNAPEEARDAQRAQRLRHVPGPLAEAMRALSLSRMPAYELEIAKVDLPIALVTGALDEKFTKVARQLCPSLKRGEHIVVERAGHNVVLEQPAAVARILERALLGRQE